MHCAILVVRYILCHTIVEIFVNTAAAVFLFLIAAYLIDDQGWHKSGGSGASIRDEWRRELRNTNGQLGHKSIQTKISPLFWMVNHDKS